MNDIDPIKTPIRNFFQQHISADDITDDSDIFALGYVNSLFAMQIVNFIEKQFNMALENKDLNVDNFRSINNISALISRKLSACGV